MIRYDGAGRGSQSGMELAEAPSLAWSWQKLPVWHGAGRGSQSGAGRGSQSGMELAEAPSLALADINKKLAESLQNMIHNVEVKVWSRSNAHINVKLIPTSTMHRLEGS